MFANLSESPIEQIMFDLLIKHVRTDVLIEQQFPLPTSIGEFRADIVLSDADRSVCVECDGKEFHDPARRDEVRDAAILSQTHVDTIWRFSGSAIHYLGPSCVMVLAATDSVFFQERTIERYRPLLVHAEHEIENFPLGGFFLPGLKDAPSKIHYRCQRHTRLTDPQGGRQFWKVIARNIIDYDIKSVAEYDEVVLRRNPVPSL